MKKYIISILMVLSLNMVLMSKLRVVATYPYISDIVEHIGKDLVKITTLAKGSRDPHFITPKPSFIAKLRKADLLIINGGQLEIGWIPPLIRQANNSTINTQSKGFLELFSFINPIEKPDSVSRAQGDVHPDGNPHLILDPENVLIVSDAITNKLSELDKVNESFYKKNNEDFKAEFNKKLKGWTESMKSLAGVKVVQYHKTFNYFFEKFNIKEAGTLEPLPGIPPSSKHINELINTIKIEKVKFIINDVFHSKKSAEFLSKKTGVKFIILPHDVKSLKSVKSVFDLFDLIVKRFNNA